MKTPNGETAVFAGVVASTALLFLAFVYGYPRVFPLLDGPSLDRVEEEVSAAIASGRPETVLGLADRARRAHPRRPLAYTLYASALTASGGTGEAIDVLEQAVEIRKRPWPSYRTTRKPYYFGPARLALGAYHLEQGNALKALMHFELARGSTSRGLDTTRYAPALYRAYAKEGFWGRALASAVPSSEELASLDAAELLRAGRVAEGLADWALARQIAAELLSRQTEEAEGHLLAGRADLAAGRAALAAGRADLADDVHLDALAHLESAEKLGCARAAYYLGAALDQTEQPAQAIQALTRIPAGVFRPFALAKAAQLAGTDKEAGTTARHALLDALDAEIARLRETARPVLYDTHRDLTPVAFSYSQGHFAAGGPFPLLVVWEKPGETEPDSDQVVFASYGKGNPVLLADRGNVLLQLQWVENHVNWQSVERLPPGTDPVPGWIDTARDWHGVREEPVAQIMQEDHGNAFLRIDNTGIHKHAWLYSVQVPADDGAGYLLAGRLRGRQTRYCLGWQFIDDDEQIIFEHDVLAGGRCDSWEWRAGYVGPRLHRDMVRARLDVMRHAGIADFDDIMLVKVTEPVRAGP